MSSMSAIGFGLLGRPTIGRGLASPLRQYAQRIAVIDAMPLRLLKQIGAAQPNLA